MEMGLYKAKYPLRKPLSFLLSYFKTTHPDHISLSLIPIGLITGFIYLLAPYAPSLYWLAIIFIFIRLIVGTLDSMVAEQYNRQSPNGEIINYLASEAADMLLLLSIIFAKPGYPVLGLFALLVSWGISYSGLIGTVAHKQIQQVGPVGQGDRLIALFIFSMLQFFSFHYHWQVDFMKIFLWWVIMGGIITIGLRCYKTLFATSSAAS